MKAKVLRIAAIVAFAVLAYTVAARAEATTTTETFINDSFINDFGNGINLTTTTGMSMEKGKALLSLGGVASYRGFGLGGYKMAGSTDSYKNGWGLESRLYLTDALGSILYGSGMPYRLNVATLHSYIDTGAFQSKTPSGKNIYNLGIGGGLELHIPIAKQIPSLTIGAGYHNHRGLVLSVGAAF